MEETRIGAFASLLPQPQEGLGKKVLHRGAVGYYSGIIRVDRRYRNTGPNNGESTANIQYEMETGFEADFPHLFIYIYIYPPSPFRVQG